MQAAETLQKSCDEIGIPENLKSDRAPDFCGQESSQLKLSKGRRINLTYVYPERSNEIYNVGITIRDLKKCWHHNMVSKCFPRRVWDLGIKHAKKVI